MTEPPPAVDDGLLLVHAVMDAAPASVVMVDADRRVTHANRRTAEVFGHDPGSLVGEPFTRLVPDEDDGDPHGRRADGTTFPVELSMAPIATRDGERLVITVRDVTSSRADAERLASLSRAYLSLARLNQATLRARSAAELYDETCRVAVEEAGYLGAWVTQRARGFRVETLALAGSLDDYVAQLDLTLDPEDPRGRGPTARTLRDGRPTYAGVFTTDPATAPWHALGETYGIRASAALPVRCGDRVVAALTLWADSPRVFDRRRRGLLEAWVENVSFALDAFDAAARLERSVTQRGELLHRLVAAQEDERTRIAGVVHDDSVQALAAVDLRLGLLARRVEEAAPALSPSVAQLQETVGAVSSGLRRLLFELEPAGPGVALRDLLRETAGHLFEDHDVHWSVRADGDAPGGRTPGAGLSVHARGQAVRIVREVLLEIRERSGATQVTLEARDVDDGVEVTITDNGSGEGLRSPGSPLGRIRDRAEVAGGWCRAEPRDPGCELRFWLPREVPGTEGSAQR